MLLLFFSKPVSHTLTNLIFTIYMYPARCEALWKCKKKSFAHLLSFWGPPSHCFPKSLWSNPSGLKLSDTVTREEIWLLSGKRTWKSFALSSLTLLSSLHHSQQLTQFPGCSQPLGLWSWYSSFLDDLHPFVSNSYLILVHYLHFPRTSPDSFTLPFGSHLGLQLLPI